MSKGKGKPRRATDAERQWLFPFFEALKEYRRAKGLTLKRAADALGVPTASLNNYEQKKTPPGALPLKRLSDRWDLRPDWTARAPAPGRAAVAPLQLSLPFTLDVGGCSVEARRAPGRALGVEVLVRFGAPAKGGGAGRRPRA